MAIEQFSADTKIVDVIDHPAFDGFGHLIFPVSKGRPGDDKTLADVPELIPHHHYVRTDTTVDVCNYFLKQANSGQRIFYDIYTEEEKAEDPRKKDTGLFFFKGKPGAPFGIVCAGGAFQYVGSMHASFPHCMAMAERGYNAFAIQYRTIGGNIGRKLAMEDLVAGLTLIFRHPEMFEVDLNCYSAWGESAGARMAAFIGSYGLQKYGGAPDLPKPGCVIMQYTKQVCYSEDEVPTAVFVGLDDLIADYRIMELRVNALRKQGVDVEFHTYPDLIHGWGMGYGTSAEGWFDDALAFWEKQRKEQK